MAKPAKPHLTPDVRALIDDPATAALTVAYRYNGVIGADGLTRFTFTLVAADASGTERARLDQPDQVYKLLLTLDAVLGRAGYTCEGELPGGMAGDVRYIRRQSHT